MAVPEDLRYAKTHEWAKRDGDEVVVGITDFAVESLQDLVFIDLPDVGKAVTAGKPFGEIESVKAVSDLIAPVSGEVTAVNGALADDLDILKRDAYGEGWMIRVKVSGDAAPPLAALLSAGDYEKVTAEESH